MKKEFTLEELKNIFDRLSATNNDLGRSFQFNSRDSGCEDYELVFKNLLKFLSSDKAESACDNKRIPLPTVKDVITIVFGDRENKTKYSSIKTYQADGYETVAGMDMKESYYIKGNNDYDYVCKKLSNVLKTEVLGWYTTEIYMNEASLTIIFAGDEGDMDLSDEEYYSDDPIYNNND